MDGIGYLMLGRFELGWAGPGNGLMISALSLSGLSAGFFGIQMRQGL
jgi:hypothetical protein